MEKLLKKIKYIKMQDILAILKWMIALPLAGIFKIYLKATHKSFWLLCEYEKEARDNAYWLFRYLAETHPEIDCYYAINPKCEDYEKVASIGKTISYGTIQHWVYYLTADKLISSQKGGKPNAAFCYFLEIIAGWVKNDRYFLQHGIVLNDLKWLYYPDTKFKLLVCSAKPEYEYIKAHFGYPEGVVKQLGLCRFDSLQRQDVPLKRQILLMPTWRNWIAHPTKDSYKIEDISDFRKTKYYQAFQGLLDSKELYTFLKEEDLSFCFYPHREMQEFISYFTVKEEYRDRIFLGKQNEKEVQELIKESLVMITDYSSVSMDFAYLKKPVIYYQFDDALYRKGHYAQSSYFSYHKNGFGQVVEEREKLIQELKKIAKNHFQMEEKYQKRQEAFFNLQDDQNCKRTLEAILQNDKKEKEKK